MFNPLELIELSNKAGKLAKLLDSAGKIDANKNGILDKDEYKPLMEKLATDGLAVKHDIEQLANLIEADLNAMGIGKHE